MIRHVVLFKFKADTPAEEKATIVAGFRAMPASIPELKDLEVGLNVVESPRAYDLALVCSFDDWAALDRYAKHPAHAPAAQRARAACEHVAVVDFVEFKNEYPL